MAEEQGPRTREKDPDWRPAPGEADGESGGSGDEGRGGRGEGWAGGSAARGSSAAGKRPRASGSGGSGAEGAGPESNAQPQGATAGGGDGMSGGGAGTSAAPVGGAPVGGSGMSGAAAVTASQSAERMGRTPTDEELDPWTEEVLSTAEAGLVRGMFGDKVKDARNCKVCGEAISWKGSGTTEGTTASGVTGGAAAGGSRQMNMGAFVVPRVGAQQLRDGLVQLFAGADLPFRLIERSEGEAAREDVRQMLVGDGMAGRMSLTFDIWTSENGLAFMGVTAHWITCDFQLRQVVLDFRQLKGSHTGDLIATELEEAQH
ncbi:unnamed protein product [Closterium sp. Naga37s-1]|nr:unnamed protein product [Closterium sp. Naga37s-1]